MTAVMLAAGVGRRLHALTQRRPKCLIEIGGRSLLYRYFDVLLDLGLTRICLVVGYKHELIREAVASYPRFPTSGTGPSFLDVTFLVNAAFERGSIGSLWVARQVFDDDLVIMDADVLFHPTILSRLLTSPSPNALLMDETVTQRTEECMVAVSDGRVVSLSKRMPARYDLVGEGVGFFRVARAALPWLLRSVEARVSLGELDGEYEDALDDFFRETPVGFEKIGGLPWIEIDFPEDVERAQREILPKLEGHGRTHRVPSHTRDPS